MNQKTTKYECPLCKDIKLYYDDSIIRCLTHNLVMIKLEKMEETQFSEQEPKREFLNNVIKKRGRPKKNG